MKDDAADALRPARVNPARPLTSNFDPHVRQESPKVALRVVLPLLPASVRVTTMHPVKGLEFDEVFLANMSEGVVPSNRILQKARKEDN